MLRNTLYRLTSFSLLLVVNGVFGVDGDEVKSVSVMEGDSVTLHTDITDIQTDDQIMWMFGPQGTLIAQIFKKSINMYDTNKIFGERLKLDSQTGSLTITNITITNSGLYKGTIIISNRETSYKGFNVTVCAHLPVPVITRISNSSNCSTLSERSSVSKCVLLCSVLNVRDVSLSWYKGNSLLSSISVSDLNIRLSLPLEVEYQDTNTYRCVVNNPITNQTQHLNINDLCQTCSDSHAHKYLIIPAVVLAVLALSVIYLFCKKHKRDKLKGNIFVPAEHVVETTEEEVHYADTTFCQQVQQNKRPCESETIYASVVT